MSEYKNLPLEGGSSGATGLVGATGIQGLTGPQGPQGAATGIQGVTGASGGKIFTGSGVPSASLGEEGDLYIDTVTNQVYQKDGINWVVQTTMLQGNTGAQGLTGLQGSTGLQGPTGLIGETGIQGLQGETGALGNTGAQGITGETGETGIQGIQGNTGIQGIQGITGQTGETGIQGIQGDTGTQGIQGIQGDTGVQGIQGDTGAQGITGLQGITGVAGDDGNYFFEGSGVPSNALGNNGDLYLDSDVSHLYKKIAGSWVYQATFSGVTGVQGLTGIQGQTGAGIQGATGLIGPTGLEGPTGPQGVGFTGLIGETGVQGIQGETGVQGIQGDTGVQGIQGDTGIQGIQGDTGIQGIQGDTGVQGIQGDTGVQGIQGDTGVTGETGIQGLEGQTGIQGIRGHTGSEGIQGPEGATGIQGPGGGDQGVTGVAGIDGATGIQGVTGPSGGGISGDIFYGNTGLDGDPVYTFNGNTGVGIGALSSAFKAVTIKSDSGSTSWDHETIFFETGNINTYAHRKSDTEPIQWTFEVHGNSSDKTGDSPIDRDYCNLTFGKKISGAGKAGARLKVVASGGVTGGAGFEFWTSPDYATGITHSVSIDNNGYVGIGTDSPIKPLSIDSGTDFGGISLKSTAKTDWNTTTLYGGGWADGDRTWGYGTWLTTTDFHIRNYNTGTNPFEIDYADNTVRIDNDLTVGENTIVTGFVQAIGGFTGPGLGGSSPFEGTNPIYPSTASAGMTGLGNVSLTRLYTSNGGYHYGANDALLELDKNTSGGANEWNALRFRLDGTSYWFFGMEHGSNNFMVSNYNGGFAGEIFGIEWATDTVFVGAKDFKVDTDTLFVDASADRVGVNTASPSQALDVVGNAKVSGFIHAVSGFTGPGVGSAGETGIAGIQGETGIQGVTGAGIQGVTGLQGADLGPNYTGETGVAGIQGETGIQGVTGSGIDGATGIQGIQGVTGVGSGGGAFEGTNPVYPSTSGAGMTGIGTLVFTDGSTHTSAQTILKSTSVQNLILNKIGGTEEVYMSFYDDGTPRWSIGQDSLQGDFFIKNNVTNTVIMTIDDATNRFNIPDDLVVDGGTLRVDASASKVGINVAFPAYPMDVSGDVNITGVYRKGAVAGITGSYRDLTISGGIVTANLGTPYGSMYEDNDSGSTITVTTAGTFYGWTTATTGEVDGTHVTFTGDATADRLTFATSGVGKYLITVACSFGGTSSAVIQGSLFKDGTEQTNVSFTRKLGVSGDVGSANCSGIVNVSTAGYLDFRFTSDDNGDTISVYKMTVTAHKIS